MKRFIRNTCLISLIILAVIIIIEFALFLRPNTYSYKSEYVNNHIDDLHTLLFGNSHIERALIPDSMDKGTFNLAISGRPLIYDIELAKMFIPKMKSLDNVVMPLDYSLFYFDRIPFIPETEQKGVGLLDDTYKCMYYKYMGIRVDRFWYWSEVLNSKLNYFTRFFISDEEARECDSLGYIQNELKTRDHAWQYHQTPLKVDLSKPKNKDTYNMVYNYYTTLSDLTYRQHTRLILISTPMFKTSQVEMIPELRDEMRAFVAQLRLKNPNVYYLDYTDDPRFEDHDFFDSSHMSVYGAAKLSKILNRDIKELPAFQ